MAWQPFDLVTGAQDSSPLIEVTIEGLEPPTDE
jgi:hypothetical protein